MAQRLKPLLDKVLVQKVMPMTKSAAGILMPETAAPRVGIWACACGCNVLHPASTHSNLTLEKERAYIIEETDQPAARLVLARSRDSLGHTHPCNTPSRLCLVA